MGTDGYLFCVALSEHLGSCIKSQAGDFCSQLWRQRRKRAKGLWDIILSGRTGPCNAHPHFLGLQAAIQATWPQMGPRKVGKYGFGRTVVSAISSGCYENLMSDIWKPPRNVFSQLYLEFLLLFLCCQVPVWASRWQNIHNLFIARKTCP